MKFVLLRSYSNYWLSKVFKSKVAKSWTYDLLKRDLILTIFDVILFLLTTVACLFTHTHSWMYKTCRWFEANAHTICLLFQISKLTQKQVNIMSSHKTYYTGYGAFIQVSIRTKNTKIPRIQWFLLLSTIVK